MILSCVLNGGLGNQLFQIASAYDVGFKTNEQCAFYLDRKVYMQGHIASSYRDTVYSKLVVLDKEIKPAHNNLVLEGYFQSEKYFIEHKDFIIDLFTHQPTIHKLRHEFALVLKNSVAIHIRRGDYIDVGEAMELDYYYEALDRLKSEVTIDNILIFSDDQDWCRENFLRLSVKTRFLSGNKDYEDLYLQSMCSHNITGNSSFSWWGAYLNTNPDKRVYMPKPWTSSHGDDIYPQGAIIIPR